MSKPQAFVHIGLQKTATTTLQEPASSGCPTSSSFPEGIAILLVVSRKTLRWMRDGEEAGYFPDVGPLDVDLLEQLKRRCGAEVYDARFALIQLAKESPGRGH
jgi:hypothetical protein